MKLLSPDKETVEVYLFSTHSPQILSAIDPKLQVRLIDSREGAIEKFSNLYLYAIKF